MDAFLSTMDMTLVFSMGQVSLFILAIGLHVHLTVEQVCRLFNRGARFRDI